MIVAAGLHYDIGQDTLKVGIGAEVQMGVKTDVGMDDTDIQAAFCIGSGVDVDTHFQDESTERLFQLFRAGMLADDAVEVVEVANLGIEDTHDLIDHRINNFVNFPDGICVIGADLEVAEAIFQASGVDLQHVTVLPMRNEIGDFLTSIHVF